MSKKMITFAAAMTHYLTTTLSCGLRVVALPSADPVVYLGIAVAAGARHETPGEEGLAHFCEHVSFKGTARRRPMQVLNCLERVGGDLNAFTNKEDTVFHAAVLREHVARAVDLLTDITFCSTFPDEETRREVDVICDEIESYRDTPSELIYDEFENRLFSGHPLGHNILGTREQVTRFTPADAHRFTRRHYRPENCVFFMHGDAHFDRVVRQLEQASAQWPTASPTPADATATPAATAPSAGSDVNPDAVAGTTTGTAATLHPTHQAHVMVGCRTFPYDDARRMPLIVLNNLLGGPAMNARLNVQLRERRGLVYTVDSSMVNYSDTGAWQVYFGCDHDDTRRCLQLVGRELDRLMQHPLTERQLAAAKRQLKGQLLIALDNREQLTLDMGRHYLLHHALRDTARQIEQIDAVTATQLQDVAQQLFAPDHLLTLTL